MSDDHCLCAPRPVGGDPQCVVHRDLHEARSAVRPGLADLLRRFERPRTHAGDYHGDFADRILDQLGYAELQVIVRDLAAIDEPDVIDDRGVRMCGLCGGGPGEDAWERPQDDAHYDNCPWRRARELLSTQPDQGDDDGE